MLYLSGVMRSGVGAHRFHYGLTTDQLLSTTQDLFDNQGLRLTHLGTYRGGDQRWWHAIYRAGDWAHWLQVGMDTDTFVRETQRRFDEEGLRLETVVPYVDGGQLRWAGSYRSGDWGHRFTVGRDADTFRNETQAWFDTEGLRLMQVAPYVDVDGQTRFAGIYYGGDWGHRFSYGLGTGDFAAQTQGFFDGEGLRLDSLARYGDGNPLWAGVYTPASDAHRFILERDAHWFTSAAQRWFDGESLHLTCLQGFLSPGRGVRVHVKILEAPTIPVDDMMWNMRELFGPLGIAVELASTESLDLPTLTDLDVGACDGATTDQTQLFANRNNAGATDLVVYFCRSVSNVATGDSFNGCASFPAGSPGVVVASYASPWTLAHEIGHALGLAHVDDPAPPDAAAPAAQLDSLMTGRGTANITNPPPDITGGERSTMLASTLMLDL